MLKDNTARPLSCSLDVNYGRQQSPVSSSTTMTSSRVSFFTVGGFGFWFGVGSNVCRLNRTVNGRAVRLCFTDVEDHILNLNLHSSECGNFNSELRLKI